MELGLKGKRALVLGGGKGLGLAIAEGLAAEGVRVALVGRNAERLAEAAARTGGGPVIPADLGQPGAPQHIVEQALRELGGIDILLNNSGGPAPSGALGVPPETWTAQFQAMVLSIMTVTELAVADMRPRKWGRILTIASSGVVQPIPTLGVSNTLRAALAAWSKTLAGEVAGDGITVNMLLPGRIDTERVRTLDASAAEKSGKAVADVAQAAAQTIPVGRYGQPSEFAAPAVFLASQQAAYITGSMIRIDGGMIKAVA